MIFGFSERVHLEADPSRLPGLRRRGDQLDLVDQALREPERRDEELPEALRAPEPCDVVEEVGDVRRNVLVRGEEPEVLVDPRGERV